MKRFSEWCSLFRTWRVAVRPFAYSASGLLPAYTAWWGQTGLFSWQPVLWSVPPGLLTVGTEIGNTGRTSCSTNARDIGCQNRAISFFFGILLIGGILVDAVGT